MNQPLILSIVAAGFTVAFFHAALPTHWLPFVVTARAQRWDKTKTLSITAFAGLGHILITTLLGVLVAWLGMNVDRLTGSIFPLLGGGLLALVGVFYIYRGASGGHVHLIPGAHGHGHGHSHHDHSHDHHHDGHEHHPHDHNAPDVESAIAHHPRQTSDRAAIVSLFTLLTLSPCEAFLPVYVSAVRYGWSGFAIASVVLAVATIAGMVTFTALTLAGLERFRLDALEKYEGIILGCVLILLGIAFVVLES
jgi:ABC-type nickel/cobalt efflux system permease component RcnA